MKNDPTASMFAEMRMLGLLFCIHQGKWGIMKTYGYITNKSDSRLHRERS